MRLDKLHIPRYRNLHNFTIDFDEGQPTTVILGRNGSGKSNLIEAITVIFRDLETGRAPSFKYKLQYVCHNSVIGVDADPSRALGRLAISIDGNALTQTQFRNNLDNYLPNYVFGYYSGWSSRLESQFDEPTRSYYQRILDSSSKQMPLRRLFFCRKEYSQIVLLAFFLDESAQTKTLLQNYLGIRHFVSALFVLKKPWWRGSGRPNAKQLAEGDPRFWYGRGAFMSFVSRLWEHALAPIRNTEKVRRDIRRDDEPTERLYLFVQDKDTLARLRHPGETSKTLFGFLESMFLCDLMDEVRVTVERTDGTRVKFKELSEGEQQLLTVLGLLLFTQTDESLYLLDEPDTHLNPVWTYDFLKLLQNNIRAEKGQLLIGTHNPLMIGSLHKNQVRVLSQGDGGTSATEPEYDPIGIGVEGLLKSELYGLRSTLAKEVLQKIDRHYQLLAKPDKSEAEQMELMQLAAEINDLGVARTHPNPYFEHFANAMARRTPTISTSLSKIEIDRQARLADEILAEILAEEESSLGTDVE